MNEAAGERRLHVLKVHLANSRRYWRERLLSTIELWSYSPDAGCEKEGLHNPFPARRAICCPRCSVGEDAGTVITVLFEPGRRAFETHGVCARVSYALRSALRVIHRLPSANSVVIWGVFFSRPRYRVFV